MNGDLEKKCVWMSAGLVLYKLCDRNYECHLCPFDQAMGGEFEKGETEEPPLFSIEFVNFYHPNHLWIRIESSEKIVMGIDSFLSSLLSNIRTIVFPNIGDHFSQDECFCHIIEKRGIIPLLSPLSGTVEALNLSLKKRPDLIIREPFKAGYLLKMRPENLEKDIKKLLFGKEALSWIKKEEKRLIQLLSSFVQKEDIGPTMQDGGIKISSIVSELKEKEYLRLIDTFVKIP